MSVYERRYQVNSGYISHYTDSPREALAFLDARKDDSNQWINEGYGDVGYQDEHRTEIIRRTTGSVLRSTLELRIAHDEIQQMLATLTKPETG